MINLIYLSETVNKIVNEVGFEIKVNLFDPEGINLNTQNQKINKVTSLLKMNLLPRSVVGEATASGARKQIKVREVTRRSILDLWSNISIIWGKEITRMMRH